MRLNDELFKTLNILYVENDEEIKETFSPTLNKLFNKVFLCSDGLDALEQFIKLDNTTEKIDVILSEYTIPSLNGLELLFKIRDISKNVPFIFITKETNVDLLLNSLRFDVTDYFFKPINEYEILKKIEEACIARQEEDEILNYQNEIEEYFELINKVAIVYSFDTNRAMLYVNNLFKELIKYDEEEILGQDYRSFFHNEMPKAIIEEQGQILQSGNKWQGKIKYLTSIDSIFYTNCTIIPVFDENKKIRKYVSVNFLTTKEENDKREFKKRVLVDIQETKRIYSMAQRKIDELTNILTSINDYEEVKENLEEEQKLNQSYYTQLEELENRVKIVKDKYELLTVGINKKISQISLMTSEMKSVEQRTNNKIVNVVEDIKSKDTLITKIKNEIDIKGTKITDLEEVLEHRKTQIRDKKAKS
jgi:PAS domain S-box-containing protein